MKNEIIKILNMLDDEDLELVYSFVNRLSYDYEDDTDFVNDFVSNVSSAPFREYVDYNEFADVEDEDDVDTTSNSSSSSYRPDSSKELENSKNMNEEELQKYLGDDYLEKIMMWKMD